MHESNGSVHECVKNNRRPRANISDMSVQGVMTTDMGDDILHFSNGKASSFGTHLNHPNVTSYCDMDLSTLP